MKVTILEKKEGESWSDTEVSSLRERSMVEIQQLPAMPHRLALMNKSVREPINKVLAGIKFISQEVDYRDRWS